MRAVIQRVSQASVTIDGTQRAAIGLGLLILVGIEEGDSDEDVEWLAAKIARLRIFNDANGVMNLSVQEISGELLVARRRVQSRFQDVAALRESVSRWRAEWQAVEKPLGKLLREEDAAGFARVLSRRAAQALGRVGNNLRQLENHEPPRELDGRWVGEASFELPVDLPTGYHELHAYSAEQRSDGACPAPGRRSRIDRSGSFSELTREPVRCESLSIPHRVLLPDDSPCPAIPARACSS